MNKYPLWKYILILFVLVLGLFYAAPNLYPPDPAIQISSASTGTVMAQSDLDRATSALQKAGFTPIEQELNDKNLLLRFADSDVQQEAQKKLQAVMGDDYIVALNQASTTPGWLRSIGAEPMKYGLDLSGGVHFLLEVDTAAVVKTRTATYFTELKRELRKAKINNRSSLQDDGRILMSFQSEALRQQARELIADEFSRLDRIGRERDGQFLLDVSISEIENKEIQTDAITQNLITLRNRVNELGVSEPLVQRQGANRIVVQLPGVQDTAEAKRILGKAANLEFRLEAKVDESFANKEQFDFRSPTYANDAFLEREIVITGDQVSNAKASFDPETSQPQVNISLDSRGGALMHRATRDNVGRRLGVLYVERKVKTERDAEGEITSQTKYDDKKIISLATIQSALGVQFRVTGLDSVAESSELALLLRAGALAAPIEFVEERTVGPSLGAENIAKGLFSVQIGLCLVLIFMLVYYKMFGLVANIALTINMILLVAVMSLLSATLTLPGIAGIVLTVGMAVDANVLIFERIREELRKGLTPHQAIKAGYDRAFVTILDANITTLLVAVILYAVGTGPVKGFAVTLSIGICTSMFTAIMCTRAMVNFFYGRRKRLQKIAI